MALFCGQSATHCMNFIQNKMEIIIFFPLKLTYLGFISYQFCVQQCEEIRSAYSGILLPLAELYNPRSTWLRPNVYGTLSSWLRSFERFSLWRRFTVGSKNSSSLGDNFQILSIEGTGPYWEGISHTYSTPKQFQAATAGLVSAELRTIQSQHAIKTWKDLYQHQWTESC